MRVAVLQSRVRVEEKLLIKELENRGVEFDLLDARSAKINVDRPEEWQKYDVVLERCVSHTRAVSLLQILNSWNVPTVNTAHVARVCGSKLETSIALAAAGIPGPEVQIAFSTESAIECIEEMGYPVVLKPAMGSWGRLLGKVNDREAAEAILEHKFTLGGVHHGVVYIQDYVDKLDGSDIRSFVIDDQTVCAIGRQSEHWITNTARGGKATNLEISDEIDSLSRAAARAVGGGVVAVDLMQDQSGKMLVNEVNYTMEFRNSVTEVNIPALMIEYVLKVGEGMPLAEPATELVEHVS